MTADPAGTHEAVEAPIPRQRDAGVMGYVAELQQFDDSMTASADGEVPEAEPEERPPAQGRPPAPNRPPALDRAPRPRRAPGGPGGGGPAEPPGGSGGGRGPGGFGPPRSGAASRVPRKPGRPPWTRTEVGLAIAFVLVAAVAIVGGAYAVLMASRPPTGDLALPLPSVDAAGEQTPAATGGPPTGQPERSAGPSPTPSARGAAPSGVGGPAGGSVPPTLEATAPAAVPDLVASYARDANTGLLGLTGYRGKVTIANRGKGAADGWTVTLSLPAGQRVDSVRGADARQEGELVTFTPLAGEREVAAGGSVVFTFEVPGLLAGEPTGCAINGRPCE
ncbi:cellulose binding domain-containing protein [Phytohabitans sp. ZYX-F-186]|uniref:Cellulose binding domain-containing protein n=1 Tax=Phytohabitans maris TaxID=3071409 RepID=A0ABU0ZAU7_9ACTN|nr:cellulose binding domain-containing protein [Phytohabitans sp. ZYX-F-186]MDQ7904185.1 cellulose binding domain-containing protein [Phytohabitans sp. ZYX-F-186]